jgi:integrase
MPLVDLDAMAVRAWLATMEREGVGARTRAKSYRLLSRILGTAIESGYLARNPCTIRGAAAEPAPEMRFATVAEIAALADAIPRRFRALVLVAAYTGLRWGELAGLRVRRVDLLHRQITVAEQLLEVRGRLAFGPTKTGAGRWTVTLPMVAAEALAEHLSVDAEAGPDGLVFPAERGGPIRRSNVTRRVWIPATRAAGVEGLRFHDLRHTAATLAVSSPTSASISWVTSQATLSRSTSACSLVSSLSTRSPAVILSLSAIVVSPSSILGQTDDHEARGGRLLSGQPRSPATTTVPDSTVN